jgi:phosphatidylglycerophosphate synthase
MCACIVAGVALGLTTVADYRIFWLVAALGAQLRLTANMLDGMVALASGRPSKIGELYNEVPDRVSNAAVFIGAGFASGGNVALGYIATILAIFTAYIRAAGKIASAPNEFCGPMAKQHRLRDYSRLQAKTNYTCLEMSNTTWQRLFGFRHAFDDRVTVVLTMAAVVCSCWRRS